MFVELWRRNKEAMAGRLSWDKFSAYGFLYILFIMHKALWLNAVSGEFETNIVYNAIRLSYAII